MHKELMTGNLPERGGAAIVRDDVAAKEDVRAGRATSA